MPTLRKFLCAMVVLASLFVCLIPKIFTSIDPDEDSSGGATGTAGVLWPLCFMIGFVSGTLLYSTLNLVLNNNITCNVRRNILNKVFPYNKSILVIKILLFRFLKPL